MNNSLIIRSADVTADNPVLGFPIITGKKIGFVVSLLGDSTNSVRIARPFMSERLKH